MAKKTNYFNYVITVRKGTGEYNPFADDNKFYAYADRIAEYAEITNILHAGQGCSILGIMPVKTATEAHQIAETWNRQYMRNGRYLYG